MKFWNVGVIYMDAPGDGGAGGGAPAGGDAGGSAPAAAGTGTGASGAAGASAAQPNAQPAAKKYEYAEDRSTWVPGHKVRAQTDKIRALEAQIAEANRRVGALAGIKTPTPQEAESAQIKEQLFAIMPELKEILEKREALLKAADFDYSSIETDRQRQWANTGNHALKLLTNELKAAYGGQDLSEKAARHYQTAFIAHLAQDDALRERFEAGFVEEVVKSYVADITEGVLSPFKRIAAAPPADPRAAAARRLPRQGGGGAPVAAGPGGKKLTGDDLHKAAFEAFSRG